MMTFDASNREVCVVRRQATMTPMQTLVLLNDPQYVEAARALADHAIEHSDTSAAQLTFVFRRLTGREPDARELATLTELLAGQRDYFARLPDERNAFLAVGDYRAELQLLADSQKQSQEKQSQEMKPQAKPESGKAAQSVESSSIESELNHLAGLAAVAGGLMSYDEFVMKR
jgi:hypothetical protein